MTASVIDRKPALAQAAPMTMRSAAALVPALLLAACATTPPPAKQATVVAAPSIRTTGLERVMGQNAASLAAALGPADQDVTEGSARRLQYSGGICILDAYLYAPSQGREPLVTHVDARQPDGRDIDRASCVAAIIRKRETR